MDPAYVGLFSFAMLLAGLLALAVSNRNRIVARTLFEKTRTDLRVVEERLTELMEFARDTGDHRGGNRLAPHKDPYAELSNALMLWKRVNERNSGSTLFIAISPYADASLVSREVASRFLDAPNSAFDELERLEFLAPSRVHFATLFGAQFARRLSEYALSDVAAASLAWRIAREFDPEHSASAARVVYFASRFREEGLSVQEFHLDSSRRLAETYCWEAERFSDEVRMFRTAPLRKAAAEFARALGELERPAAEWLESGPSEQKRGTGHRPERGDAGD